MRYRFLTAPLGLAMAIAQPAHAGWYVKMHGTADNLNWQANNGHALELSSKSGKGIDVVTIAPESRDGLKKDDLITAVDGHAVSHVKDLLTYANAHAGSGDIVGSA